MNENNFEQLTGQITNNPVTQFWVAGDIHLPVNQQALAWCKRGSESYATGRTQEALHCFRQAAQLVSNSGGIYYAQAICLIKMGQVAEARVSLQQEISNPQVHPRARELLKELQNGLNLESSSKDIITFFAIPKSFQNHHIATIQRNAIRSWTLLQPRPEIILFGNEAGTAEIARELGLRHIPDVKRNEFGTPLLSDLFHQAQLHASQTVLTYINADIILTSDFIPVVHQVATQFTQNFLMIGQRWELDIATLLNFDEPTWETQLRECLPQTGRLHEVTAIDYYVFRKNLWPTIPPFAIGRTVWDNWLVYNALTTQHPVIDATQVVTIIHQSHDYAHLRGGKQEAWNGIEAQRNRFLAGGGKHLAFISHATWQLTPTGLTQKTFQQNVPTPVPLNSAPTQERLKNTSWQLQTPVAFIIFNRPDTTERVFEAIRQAKPPKLLVVADGPRQDRPDEAAKCAATRAIINRVDWPCEVLTNYSETNLGCKHRPASGITWVFSQVEEAIILEDDCLPHPSFFRFCEELLERYRHDKRIMAISGDNFQFGRKRGEHSYYFSRYNHIWGWASWRRAWQLYDVQMTRWPQAREQNWLASLLKSPPAVKQWSRCFQSCHDGLDAWDYAWTFTCWLHNGLTILPNVNLISNIGFGPAATHTTMSGSSSANMPTEAMNFPLRHPPIIVRDEQADDFTERTIFSGGIPLEPAQTNINQLVQQAITHLNANQNQEALTLLNQVLQNQPELVSLYYGKAVALARLSRISEAVETLNELLTKVPTHEKGKQLLMELQAQQAPVSSPLKSQSPLVSVTHLMQQAQQSLTANHPTSALNLLSQAKAHKHPAQNLDTLRAVCFLKLNQAGAAWQALLEELRYFPDNADAKNLLQQIETQVPQLKTSQIQDPEFQQLFNLVRSHTMLSEARLYSLFSLVKRICIENLPGNIVECGVAGGGSTALMAMVIKRYTKQQRWLYAFDSFDGMPPPTQHDKHQGMPAPATGWGTGTCAGSEEHLRNLCVQLGIADLVKPVKGYFQDTLPKMRNWVGMITLLHLDGDWYESTKVILHHLYDRVVHNGFLQVDDYGYWEGCRQAVHEFETSHALQFEINRIDDTGVWFVKPDKFPFNPILAPPLINEFFQDDPVTLGVQSQMSQNERFQLYYALRKLLPTPTAAPLRFIEIGSFAGASLWLTCQALKRVTPHFQGFAIEPGHHPQLLEVLKHVHPRVTHLPMLSPQAVPQLQQQFARDGNFPLFIFVDGDHTYEGVWRDAMDYFQLLAPGGLMVFHDYLPPLTDENREAILFHHGGKEPGVRQAFEELVECTYGEVVEIPLLSPADPTQTMAHLPIIPGVVSTIRVYRKGVV